MYSSRDLNGSSKTITLNDTLCSIQLNEKSTIIENYDVETIADRHYRYTYSFKNNDFENAKMCK